jgi:hypothetical protein
VQQGKVFPGENHAVPVNEQDFLFHGIS